MHRSIEKWLNGTLNRYLQTIIDGGLYDTIYTQKKKKNQKNAERLTEQHKSIQ